MWLEHCLTNLGATAVRRIRVVYLSGGSVTDDAVPELLRLRGLRTLGLTDVGISPAGLSRLRSGLPHCRVLDSRRPEEARQMRSPFTGPNQAQRIQDFLPPAKR